MAEGFNATQRELEILELRKENTALRTLAKELSDALLTIRPLGGSELFTNRCGAYYADPKVFKQIIQNDKDALHEARKADIRLRRSSRLTSQLSRTGE